MPDPLQDTPDWELPLHRRTHHGSGYTLHVRTNEKTFTYGLRAKTTEGAIREAAEDAENYLAFAQIPPGTAYNYLIERWDLLVAHAAVAPRHIFPHLLGQRRVAVALQHKLSQARSRSACCPW